MCRRDTEEIALQIAPSLNKLFKLIVPFVRRAEYPSFWKVALHKRKEVTLAKNYRPVTVVPNEDRCSK